MKRESNEPVQALGRGVYSASEAVRLVNFHRTNAEPSHCVSGKTISRWLRGYDYRLHGEIRHSDPLWSPDYSNDDDVLELSFRDLIELRFVKAFRDLGLGLPTIRECFMRAVEEVQDERPFSTKRFRTDGSTIFLEITNGDSEGHLIDLRRRQSVFRRIVAPSLKDLEFDADTVSRWFPLGTKKKETSSSILLAPSDAR
jgi:hypothetical protein